MVPEIEAARPRREAQRQGRERALPGRHPVTRSGDVDPEEARSEGGDVGVGDDRVGRQALAVRQLHPRDAAPLGHDPRDVRAQAQAGAAPFRESGHRFRKPAQAALDGPDARLLHMGDQHQRGWRLEGRGPAIGRVAPEQLPQPRLAKILAECRPQGGEGLDPPQAADAGQPDPLGQIDRARPVGADERSLQRAVDLRRAGAEAAVALGLAGAGEGADGVRRRGHVGEQVEPVAGVPGVPGEQGGRPQGDGGVECRAGFLEEFVEDPAHGEDRRARLDGDAADGQRAHLAPDRGGAFQHGHVEPGRGKAGRRREPADAGADHDDALLRHVRRAPLRIGVDPDAQQCQS